MAKGRKGKQITHFAVKRRIEDVIGSDIAQVGRPLVISGNDTPGGAKRRELVVQKAATVSVRDNLLRIQEEADPLGFLIAVQQGDLIPVTYVSDDGMVTTEYHQAGLDQRISVAKFLASKVLPTLSVTKHVMEPPVDPSKDEYDPSRPGQANKTFAQIVQDAALKRRQMQIMDVELGDIEYVEAKEADHSGGEAEAGDGASGGGDPGQVD